jgi:glycosyltransferase involved in cell wall biosynthesis
MDIDVEPQPGKLVFTGSMTFSPNYQGMQWFTGRVLPQIIEAYPEVKLTITGKTDGINLPGGKHVQLAGYIDDVRPMIASSWASIAPIFSGGGTRLKILEAFGLRTPVIATSKGAEGLDVEHEKHIIIADSEDEFVKETIRLLNDADLRQELIDNAFQLVSEEYDWKVIMPRFLSLIEESIN